MLKITLELDKGIQIVSIQTGTYDGTDGCWIDIHETAQAFIRRENGKWVQRAGDDISVNDMLRITAAMHECNLNHENI